jgi:hypothetical protein
MIRTFDGQCGESPGGRPYPAGGELDGASPVVFLLYHTVEFRRSIPSCIPLPAPPTVQVSFCKPIFHLTSPTPGRWDPTDV